MFESETKDIRTPLRKKNEIQSKGQLSKVKQFFDMVSGMSESKKYKKIKISVEFVDSD